MSGFEPARFSGNPRNAGVLAYLSKHRRESPLVLAHDAIPNPYYSCGCHPDIVAYLWERLAKALPDECRCIVYGTPALAHTSSGLVLAIGLGTQYVMRLTADRMSRAVAAGAKRVMQWSGGSTTDASIDLGEDWCFGAWLGDEGAWLRETYDAAAT